MARKYNIENLIGNLSDKENFVEPEKVPNLYPDDTRVDISGDAKEQSILDIDIRCLKDNPNNHFAPLSEEAWEEFKGSIKEMGILTPLIVRKAEQEGFYEILAGHNRKNAAKEIGLTKLPCIVVEADDVEASVIVGVALLVIGVMLVYPSERSKSFAKDHLPFVVIGSAVALSATILAKAITSGF